MKPLTNKDTKKLRASKSKILSKFSLNNIPLPRIIYATVFVNITNIALIVLLQKRLPPEIPLFYGLAKGEGQVAASTELIIPPVLSLSITFVNIAITSLIKNSFLRQALVATILVVTLFSLVATLKILLLVGYF